MHINTLTNTVPSQEVFLISLHKSVSIETFKGFIENIVVCLFVKLVWGWREGGGNEFPNNACLWCRFSKVNGVNKWARKPKQHGG